MTKRKHHEIIQNIEHKHCGKCDKWKTLDKFGKCKRNWDGKRLCCKSCVNKKKKQRRKVALEKRKQARENAPTGFSVCLYVCCTIKDWLQPLDQFIGPYVRNDEPTDTCKTCRDKQNEAQKRRCAACQKVWDDWRKTHPCVKCMNDPKYVHNYLLIEADHLGGKVTHCSNMNYWSHSKRGPAVLRAELMKCQALCVFHHALQTQQRSNKSEKTSILRKRRIINVEKHKRGCCSNFKCKRVLKKGEECAFHFDHRDASTKFMYNGKTKGPSAFANLSDAVFDTQWPLEKELVDLLCANCHKVKPGGNRDGYK